MIDLEKLEKALSSIDITPEQRESLLTLLHRHLPGVKRLRDPLGTALTSTRNHPYL